MKNKIPFIIPENDLNYRLLRIIVQIKELGENRNGKSMLDLDKVSIFDFLLKNPFILNDVLKAEGRTGKIVIEDNDRGSIDTQFPNIVSLFDYGTIRGYLQYLITLNLIEVIGNESINYKITDQGNILVEMTNTEHVQRITELSKALAPLRTMSTTQLIKKIKPFVKGV